MRPGRTAGIAIRAAGLAGMFGCGPYVQVLYPHPETPRLPGEIATISGPIESIDERPVFSRGAVFHVLPGCHVVRLMERIGELNDTGVGWSAHLSPHVYVFQTKPGHAYSITLDARQGTGPFGQVAIVAIERAPNGAVRGVAPAKDAGAVEACLGRGPAGAPAPE